MKFSSIMIVDDNESDQFLTREMIEEFDASITIFQAYDGEEALEQLDAMNEQVSLIILDINMPRMNGFEFLEEYNKRESKSAIIAMLTSSDQEQDKKRAAQYDCVKDFYLKPLQSSDLERLINL